MDKILAYELLTKIFIGLLNEIGSSRIVSNIIASQIKEGRSKWTPEERKLVQDDLEANKKYSKDELNKPD
jgi:hypothetical protein